MLRPLVAGRNLHNKFGEKWGNGPLLRRSAIPKVHYRVALSFILEYNFFITYITKYNFYRAGEGQEMSGGGIVSWGRKMWVSPQLVSQLAWLRAQFWKEPRSEGSRNLKVLQHSDYLPARSSSDTMVLQGDGDDCKPKQAYIIRPHNLRSSYAPRTIWPIPSTNLFKSL